MALESDEFFKAFDGACAAMPEGDKKKIFPYLEAWLVSCAESDGSDAPAEKQIVEKIKARISLDREIKRLAAASRPASVEPRAEEPAAGAQGPVAAEGARMITGHEGEVTSVDVSPDGRYVLSGSADETVRLWDFEKGTELRAFQGHETDVMCVCFCAGGRRVVSGDRMGTIGLWDVESGDAVWIYEQKGHGGVTGLSVSSDAKYVVSSSNIGGAHFA